MLESGSSRPRVKSARVNSARSTRPRPVWGSRYGGKVVRLDGGCICMFYLSVCQFDGLTTYLIFSATLEVSNRESLMACQRSSNHVLNQPIKIQIFNALAVVQTNP